MEALDEAIHSSLGCPDHLGSLLSGIVADGTVTARVNAVLASLAAGTTNLATVSPSRMVLARGRDYVLYIRRISVAEPDSLEESTHYLSSTRSNSVYVFQGAAEVKLRRYALPPDLDTSVFRPGVELSLVDEVSYGGGPLHEGLNDGFVYDCSASQEVAMVRVDYAPFATQAWHFDRERLVSAFPSAAHVSQSTLQSLALVLGALRQPEALPHLRTIASHSSHFVRWAAIQATGLIDRAAAFQLIEEAAFDPHPEVQSAARQILSGHGRTGGGQNVRS